MSGSPKTLRVMRILVVLAAVLVVGIHSSSSDVTMNDEMPAARVKRYVNFNLLKPYFSPMRDEQFERPIILETRDARNKLDCILNLRSFELCRGRL
ncbi:hypothetical protein RB195_000541 [Necator americanus]|uniref:Uncharacterized protein n=1 Tax=Necator americanus TaxID=51031 RepID=A0ABR1DB41_NECAM